MFNRTTTLALAGTATLTLTALAARRRGARPVLPGEALMDEASDRDLTAFEHAAVAQEWARTAGDLAGFTRRGRELVALRLAAGQVHATLASLDIADQVAQLTHLIDSELVARRVDAEHAEADAAELAALARADEGYGPTFVEEEAAAGLGRSDAREEADRLARVVEAGDFGSEAILAAVKKLGLPNEGETWNAWDARVLDLAARVVVGVVTEDWAQARTGDTAPGAGR